MSFSYTDIHFHLVPKVDDGAKSIEDSMKMLTLAVQIGIKKIIATSHFHLIFPIEKQFYEKQFSLLKQKVKEEQIPIELYLGNEIYYREDTIQKLLNQECFTLAGSRYILLEFHPEEAYQTIANAVKSFRSLGFLPIIAHIERYRHVMHEWEKAENLVSMGAYLQMNATTVVRNASSFFCTEIILLRKKIVHFIASDSHNLERMPYLKKARRIVKFYSGKSYAQLIFQENQEKILQNQVL
ncbi:tyrosine protein phosphatase [Clostridia bacterium]|nr:tyrosine protein phosphatase [Clostridia bacterium]